MLQESFIHISGIGETTERNLWGQGIRTWSDLESAAEDLLGPKRAQLCLSELEESRAAFESGELDYFKSRLGSAHAWRMLPFCDDSIAYLDIETTGLGFPPVSHSTSVAVVFRGELFVEWEQNKKRELFERLQEEAKMWVTFNGLSFDLPFLRKEFGLPLNQPHLDLRVWMRRLGHKGGLKKIQKMFPDIPDRAAMDIDGYDAVRLWRMHKKGVPGALETLMTYNAEDTTVLESLVHHAWNLEGQNWSHIEWPERAKPNPPPILTKIDSYVYDLLRGQETWNVPSDW